MVRNKNSPGGSLVKPVPPHVKLGGKPPPKNQPEKHRDLSQWLDRNAACDLIGCSLTSLLHNERQGRLHPLKHERMVQGGQIRHVIVYDPKELAEVALKYHQGRGNRPAGELAARAYEMFDEGKTMREVVIALREAPPVLEELKQRWTDDGGAERIITPEAWDQLTKIVGPFRSVTDLVEKLEALLPPREPAA